MVLTFQMAAQLPYWFADGLLLPVRPPMAENKGEREERGGGGGERGSRAESQGAPVVSLRKGPNLVRAPPS